MAQRIKSFNNKKILLLITIVFLAGFLRFWQLDSVPTSLTWDEVAWAYNAYSLGIDGRDEFGKLFPLFYLESFGDFKPPLYAYLSVIPVWLFGMTAFAARFASAFLGTMTVLCTYFLVRRIFFTSDRREWYALCATALFALSPWHIMLSRGAWEANIVTFLLVLGVWLFLKGIQDKSRYIVLSAIVFALAPYTFNTGRIVMPLLVLGLAAGFYRTLLQQWKTTVIAILVGLVILVPYVPHLVSPQASLRFREVTYFSDISVAERFNEQVTQDDNAIWSRILHHRYFIYSVMFLEHYLDHLNPVFLFVQGDDNPKFSVPDVGQEYLWSLPFFIVGLLLLIRRKEDSWWIVPFWILIGIVPAATAWDTPHALRIGTTSPMFAVVIGYGVVASFFWIRSLPIRRSVVKGIVVISVVGLFMNVLIFLHSYFVHYNREYSAVWQNGYKEIISFTEEKKNDYDEIRMSTVFGRPYIYVAYHTKIDPSELRDSIALYRESFGFVTVTRVGKYHFEAVQDHVNSGNKKILYLSEPEKVHPDAVVLKEFYYMDGTPSMVAYEIKNEI